MQTKTIWKSFSLNQRPRPKGTRYASENIFPFRDKSRGIKPTNGNEHLFNKILGINLILWGIAGALFSDEKDFSVVRLCITCINLLVGILIFFRTKAIIKASILSNPHWIIVILCNGIIFKLSQPIDHWLVNLEILFVFGALFTLVSFLCLGNNFSIRPAVRGLSTIGTYKIVRHPCYLGESLMTLACVIASNNYYSVLIFIVLLSFQVWRINEEEKMLKTLPLYKSFSKKTKWRLLPLVW